MAYYHGIIYFNDGSKMELGRNNSETAAERQAAQEFERQSQIYKNQSHHKPSRYVVVEDK